MKLVMACRIYAFDETLVETTVFQLLQWKHALKLEIETGMTMSRGMQVSTHLRKLLKTPKRYPAADLLQHVTDSLASIVEQQQSYPSEAPGYQQSDNWPE